PSHAARVKTPVCSRQCNGQLRGAEWKKHAHKGRAAWSKETSDAYREKIKGSGNPSWKGGTYIEPEKGYRMVRMPGHPRALTDGHVADDLLVMEQMIGSPVVQPEELQHVFRYMADNSPEILKLFPVHMSHWMTEHF